MVLRSTDLMIGDCVLSKSISKPCKVVGIDPREGIGENGYTFILQSQDNVMLFAHAVSVEPIPLTAEIIDMVGHHPKMALYWDDKKTEETGENWYELRICKDGDTALTMEIRYVHELQHALRLCGIENEIML